MADECSVGGLTQTLIGHQLSGRVKYLVLLGIALAIAAILLLIGGSAPETTDPNLPEARCKQALDSGKPTLVFVTSYECQPCRIMAGRVGIVGLEFTEQVVMINLDMYDQRNKLLLKKLNIGYIPTLIFYDQSGNEERVVGVIELDELRQKLSALVGGN